MVKKKERCVGGPLYAGEMTDQAEIKRIELNGERYACTIKRVLYMDGAVGAEWIHEARDSRGVPVGDRSVLDSLERIAFP